MNEFVKRVLDAHGGLARFRQFNTVQVDVVERFLRQQFFRLQPPKTAGREEFGRDRLGQDGES